MLVAAPQLREQESECHTAVPGTAAPALRPQEGQHGPWALCSSVCCSPPRISSSPYARHVLHVTQQHTAFLRGFDSGQENDQLKKKNKPAREILAHHEDEYHLHFRSLLRPI